MTAAALTPALARPSRVAYPRHTMLPTTPHAHLPGLDAVRGIACLLVLVVHALNALQLNLAMPAPPTYVAVVGFVGGCGLRLFFALSGFLITGILIDSLGERGYFRRFYWRRALRILPLYYAALAIVFLVLPIVAPATDGLDEIRSHQWLYWLHLSNWWIAMHGERFRYLGHFWSLAIEEQFYFFWPAVVWATRGGRNLASVCIAFLVTGPLLRFALPIYYISGSDMLTPIGLDLLAAGSLLAWAVRHVDRDALLRALVVGAAIAVAALVTAWHVDGEVFGIIAPTSVAVIACALVLASTRMQWGTLSAPLRWVGRRSYAIYVFHFPIMFLAVGLWEPVANALHPVIAHAGYLLASGLVAAGAAELSWRLLESPCLALRERWKKPVATPVPEPIVPSW